MVVVRSLIDGISPAILVAKAEGHGCRRYPSAHVAELDALAQLGEAADLKTRPGLIPTFQASQRLDVRPHTSERNPQILVEKDTDPGYVQQRSLRVDHDWSRRQRRPAKNRLAGGRGRRQPPSGTKGLWNGAPCSAT